MYIQSQNSFLSIFKEIQVYSEILMFIQPHSRCAIGGRGDTFPALFKNQKSVLILGRKPLIVFIFHLKCSFNSIQEKKLKNVFLLGFFLVFLTKYLSECLSSTNSASKTFRILNSERLPRHIQNYVIGHYLVLFRHMQNLVQCLHMQKPGILEIFDYSEPFHLHPNTSSGPCHICENLRILRTLTYLKPETHSKPCQKFKMEFFTKIDKQ